jgi:hypothetical protein
MDSLGVVRRNAPVPQLNWIFLNGVSFNPTANQWNYNSLDALSGLIYQSGDYLVMPTFDTGNYYLQALKVSTWQTRNEKFPLPNRSMSDQELVDYLSSWVEFDKLITR